MLANILNKYPAISEALERYRDRLYRLITRIAHFMLAVGDRFQTAIPREWYLLIVTNASAERRRRLVRIMTCPGVQPIALQYLLGQQSWSADMFDRYPHTDLANCDAIGDFFTAYTGLAHCENGDTFVYSGSATSICAEKGEISRMMGHRRILALGHDEINRRRGRGVNGSLFIHSKMSAPGARSFFFPMTRLSLNQAVSSREVVKMRLMTYLIENYNTIHLAGQWSPHSKTRLAFRSQHLRAFLRPDDFPHSPWRSGNVVLPLTQNIPIGSVQVLGTAESNYLNSAALRSYLQQRLLSDRNVSMPRSLVDQVLLDGNIPNTRRYRDLLTTMWRSLCEEHDIHPWRLDTSKSLNLSILWVAIKRHAEAAGLIEGTDEDGRIQLREFGLNWKEISNIAESIAPPHLRTAFSPINCIWLFTQKRSALFNEEILLRQNWNQLSGKYFFKRAMPLHTHCSCTGRGGGLNNN